MIPFRAPVDYTRWADVAALIREAFAYMEPLLGHPPRATSVTEAELERAAASGNAYLIETADFPIACLFTRPSKDIENALYLGWLAVAANHRGAGLARTLMDCAEVEASQGRYSALTLDTGKALTDLHDVFQQLGYCIYRVEGEIITFRKQLA